MKSKYEYTIEDFIPEAERYAHAQAGPEPRLSYLARSVWADRWDRLFLLRMDYLTHKAGLRTLAYQTDPEERILQ